MAGRKKSWFGVARSFVKAVEKENARSEARARQQTRKSMTSTSYVEPTITVSISGDDGNQYVSGMRRMARNEKYISSIKNHLKQLVSFYREHAVEYEMGENENPAPKFMKQLFPNADAHTCPHCGVIHDFTATRARKCPDCGNQMIVRQGVFLKQEQVDKFQDTMTKFYEKIEFVRQLKYSIERVQSDLSNDNYGDAYLKIAEAYQACALIYNKRYEGGYSAWDYSWRVLNGEALEITVAGARNASDVYTNGYTEVVYERGRHCMKELKYSETQAAMNKYAKIAINEFYYYLVLLNTLGLTDWNQEAAVKNIYIAQMLGKVSSDDIVEIRAKTFEKTSPTPSREAMDRTVQQVEEYIFLENGTERLKQLIY
jgi:predicted RNA-binding Zn-ribbon protein involved in translation (DUF1610 family)